MRARAGTAGKDTYKNSPDPDRTNTEVDVSEHYDSYERADAHSFDVEHPETITDAAQEKDVHLKPIEN